MIIKKPTVRGYESTRININWGKIPLKRGRNSVTTRGGGGGEVGVVFVLEGGVCVNLDRCSKINSSGGSNRTDIKKGERVIKGMMVGLPEIRGENFAPQSHMNHGPKTSGPRTLERKKY